MCRERSAAARRCASYCQFCRPMKWTGDCLATILVCFPPTKAMEVMKIHFGHYVGNTTPGTEILRFFCAGICLLQLGVALVFLYFSSERSYT